MEHSTTTDLQHGEGNTAEMGWYGVLQVAGLGVWAVLRLVSRVIRPSLWLSLLSPLVGHGPVTPPHLQLQLSDHC